MGGDLIWGREVVKGLIVNVMVVVRKLHRRRIRVGAVVVDLMKWSYCMRVEMFGRGSLYGILVVLVWGIC